MYNKGFIRKKTKNSVSEDENNEKITNESPKKQI